MGVKPGNQMTLLLLVIGGSACFNRRLSGSIFFGRPGDFLPAGTLSLEILTNLLINQLDTAGFSDLLAFYSIYFCFAYYFP